MRGHIEVMATAANRSRSIVRQGSGARAALLSGPVRRASEHTLATLPTARSSGRASVSPSILGTY
jgi:hypothetical protein